MFAPPYARETDREKLLEIPRKYPFGALVSVDHQGAPQASHLPFEVESDAAGEVRLLAHLARANPQWRHLEPDREVLAIFTGPDAYVSPRWYGHLNVPTWNYVAVHVHGLPRLLHDGPELRALVGRQVERHEPAGSDYQLEALPASFLERELRGIVGVVITVTKLSGSFKLSGNRDAGDFASVLAHLEGGPGSGEREVAEWMRRRPPHRTQS